MVERERGHEIAIRWHGRPARAWRPRPLADDDFPLPAESVRRTERAAAALRRASEHLPASLDPLARLLLRAEGMASSFVEGIPAPLPEVMAAEIGVEASPAARSVASNLAIVADAVRGAKRPLSVPQLHRWHRALMERYALLPASLVGSFRREQGWVGGSSPLDAAFVPPPPSEVPELISDLVAFANRDDLDPVTQASLLHAQFEVIHPYGDGNGRVGRVLLSWLLARRLDTELVPPLSVFIARDPGGYLSGLTLFRLGRVPLWVDWMARLVQLSSDSAYQLVDGLERLRSDWRRRLPRGHRDARAREALESLPLHPLVNSSLLAERLHIAPRTARAVLRSLAQAEILAPYSEPIPRRGGRPQSWWFAPEVAGLVESLPGLPLKPSPGT